MLTLLIGLSTNRRYIALLDHGGMSVADVEEKFANWGDPEPTAPRSIQTKSSKEDTATAENVT